MTRRIAGIVALLALALPAAGAAQATVGGGTTVGGVSLPNGMSQSDLNGIIKVSPAPWFAVTAVVSAVSVRQTVKGATATSSGIGDLPITASVATALHTAWSPELGAALDVTLPTGDPAAGLGTGTTGLAADLGVGVTPHPRLGLALGMSKELSGSAGTSALSASNTASLSAEGEYEFQPGWRGSLSFDGDVGTADSGQVLNRSIGLGLVHALHGDLALTLDAGHGLTSAAPGWAFAIGFGTVFGGNNPVSGAFSSKRLAHAFSSAVGRGQGQGHVGHKP